jgi:DNA (cytosine-5)-methyltransferase 1
VIATSKKSSLSIIDLFAGCGGLSLGLEMSGFETLLFSELNKDAAETFVRNRTASLAAPKLIQVGDIHTLTQTRATALRGHLRNWESLGIREVDLVCGGPPCQGYSGIGHRRTFKLEKQEIPSNHLFQEMIAVIKTVQPRMFLFENVAGLLSSRWTPSGDKGEIFRDVVGKDIGFGTLRDYCFRWQLIHAKDYGVPQNRPRILLLGIRKDQRCLNSGRIARPVRAHDRNSGDAVEAGWIPKPNGNPPHLVDLLSDLVNARFEYGGQDSRYACAPKTAIQRWLRSREGKLTLPKGAALTEQEYSAHSEKIVTKFKYMLENDGEIPPALRTKKFAQRVLPRKWDESGPSITATSLADDYVHYSQPRTLTVREWARLQTFPDWYQFAGSRTTGGRRRAGDPSIGDWSRDVPKYTQIGNAVPVLLAKAVGDHLRDLLEA